MAYTKGGDPSAHDFPIDAIMHKSFHGLSSASATCRCLLTGSARGGGGGGGGGPGGAHEWLDHDTELELQFHAQLAGAWS